MRVLIVNTSERTGGAAIAANRLMMALKSSGIKARMLVRDKQTDQLTVVSIPTSWKLTAKFIWERLVILFANRLSYKNIFQVDIANTGTDISQMFEFKQADVIHLHWVNQGFLSMKNLNAIMQSGKPIVITMHDMWYFTGICHYSGDCKKYTTKCEKCPILYGGVVGDLAQDVFNKKRKMFMTNNVVFVGCSQWISDLCRRSRLAKGHTILSIPNAINTDLFAPMDKHIAREETKLPSDKFLILFGSQRITDKRKGFNYLAEACDIIKSKYPELIDKIGVVVLGENSDKVKSMLPFDVYPVSYVSSQTELVRLYNAVDLYVTPSLQDNLPNTIVEAMSCGIPCVGFNVGGIPEMINHMQNGYVAKYQDAEDFANGIYWCMQSDNYMTLCCNARNKAVQTYSQDRIAHSYSEVYDMAIQMNRKR